MLLQAIARDSSRTREYGIAHRRGYTVLKEAAVHPCVGAQLRQHSRVSAAVSATTAPSENSHRTSIPATYHPSRAMFLITVINSHVICCGIQKVAILSVCHHR
jgi:hypothetical protein